MTRLRRRPNSFGISPDMLVLAMLRVVRVEILPKVEGIAPVRLFIDKSRIFSLGSWPSSLGRRPVRLLFSKLICSRLRQLDRLIGIVPLIKFPARITR